MQEKARGRSRKNASSPVSRVGGRQNGHIANSGETHMIDDILDGSAFVRMDMAQSEAEKSAENGVGEASESARSRRHLNTLDHAGAYFVRQQSGGRNHKPTVL